jgi:hypothetical protein
MTVVAKLTKPKLKKIFIPILRARKQRLMALFFCALMLGSLATPFSPLIAAAQAAEAKKLTPLAQEPKEEHVTKLSPVNQQLQKTAKNTPTVKVGDNTEVRRSQPTERKETATKITDASHEVTTFNDGTEKVRSYSKDQYAQKDGQWQRTIGTFKDDMQYAANNPLPKTGLNALLPSKNTARSTKADSGKLSLELKSFINNDGIVLKDDKGKTVSLKPLGVRQGAVPKHVEVKNGSYEVYEDVWPGVDLRYEYFGDHAKETIVLNKKPLSSTFSFVLTGGEFEKRADGKWWVKDSNIVIEDFSVSAWERGVISNPPLTVNARGSIMVVTLDNAWLKGLSAKNFPVFIDPNYYVRNGISNSSNNYVDYKSDGYVCNSANCWMHVGALNDSGVNKNWHNVLNIPYSQIAGKSLAGAFLYTRMQYSSGWPGYADGRTVWVSWAPSLSYNYGGGGAPVVAGTIGQDGWIDVTPIYNWLKDRGDYGGWITMWSEEWHTTSFKQLDPYNTLIDFYYADYNARPTAPGVITPTNKQPFVEQQPTFRITPSSDGNGDALQYFFRITGAGTTDCQYPTNVLADSGLTTALQWTPPDGILQDGEKYKFCAYSYDNAEGTYHYAGGNYWNWTSPIEFTVDLRLGKDKTQTYDTAGPVNVDYSTGNVTTSLASHTMSALGGSIGVNLEYNSPAMSRSGLEANYYNNQDRSGLPVITRTDGNIDFNWDTGSPSFGIVQKDNFSAAWTGYFIAPETGTYTFGTTLDDWARVTVNNVVQQERGCCGGPQYGTTTITLSAGQVVPIKVEYYEIGGAANMTLLVKTPSNANGQIVPREWLRTAPKPQRAGNGLTGRYYKLESNEGFTVPSNRQPFMTRLDSIVNQDYGTGSPIPGAPADRFSVRWKGYVTAPQDTDYQFCVTSDDGMRLSFDNNMYAEAWVDRGPTETCGPVQNWKTGQTKAVTLDYYENGGAAAVSFKVKYLGRTEVVPTAWLTPGAKVLPDGWTLGVDPDGSIAYENLRATGTGVTLYDSTGEKHLYSLVNGAYKPPVNEYGFLTRNTDGSFLLQDSDGRTYNFDSAGLLIQVTTPEDDRQPAALKYEYGGSPSRIQKIKDGVDPNRYMSLYYGGDAACPAIPAGFDAAPANMLCAATTTDGKYTYFRYKLGNLAATESSGLTTL